MKAKLTACLILILLMLAGCSAGDGEYYTSLPHEEKEPASLESLGTEGITGYYTLKGTLLNMVNMGVQEDVLRIGDYTGNLDDDLKAVIYEITSSEPIGIYGVSSISAEQTRVLAYREIAVQIQYKRTASEMQAVITVNSPYDLENRMKDMFSAFSTVQAYYIRDTSGHPQDIENQLYAAWMKGGARSVGLMSTTASFYPENSASCVVEITASYSLEKAQLEEMAQFITQSAQRICADAPEGDTAQGLDFINQYLFTHAHYDDTARRVVNETGASQPKTDIYTAYGVFSGNTGAQSGFVLAASAMCDALGIEHTVETGNVNGDIYSWIRVTEGGRQLVFDVTARQNGRDVYLYAEGEGDDLFIPW